MEFTNDDATLPRRRRMGVGTWLLGGILLLLALTLGLREAQAEGAAELNPIVGQHNAIAQPQLRTLGSAIRMPQLATTHPILGGANAIQLPALAVATQPILGATNAIQQPQLAVVKAPILGSGNAIQQPQLAFASLGSQLQAVRLPILGSGNAIVSPRLGSSLGMTTTPTLVDLPTTGAGIAGDSLLPTLLVLLLAGLAVVAFALAIVLQRHLVPREPASRRPRLRFDQVHPLLRYGGDPIA